MTPGVPAASTKDGVLIARHDAVSRCRQPARIRRSQAGGWRKQSGWFARDFRLAEIKTLRATVTEPERPQQNNGKFRIVTLQEIVDFATAQSATPGRGIAIYPRPRTPVTIATSVFRS